jgi:hypothetical protein
MHYHPGRAYSLLGRQAVAVRCIPRRQHQALGAVFAVLLRLALLEHAEGLAGERGGARRVGRVFGGVDDVGQLAVRSCGSRTERSCLRVRP